MTTGEPIPALSRYDGRNPEPPYHTPSDAPDWQQKCLDLGFKYWRAPDAHGVTCTSAQAVELLQEVLGVEVEIENPMNALFQERNTRYLAALVDIGNQDENAPGYLPTAHLKGQRARKAIQ